MIILLFISACHNNECSTGENGCCKPDVMIPEIESLNFHYREKINIVHIDSHLEPDITDRFKVKNNPTTFIFDKKGGVKHILDYYYSAGEIMNKIQEMEEG
ncbi:MAG: hypothetical protein JXB88_18925 [Spirochaetales bacterium]|nr:hypothetical protein [Spirochaetales bacterium]